MTHSEGHKRCVVKLLLFDRSRPGSGAVADLHPASHSCPKAKLVVKAGPEGVALPLFVGASRAACTRLGTTAGFVLLVAEEQGGSQRVGEDCLAGEGFLLRKQGK